MRLAIVLLLALTLNASAHFGKLDVDNGHFDSEFGRYHFHTEDGVREPTPEGIPSNPFVGPWVFTVVPASDIADDIEHLNEDAILDYTNGEYTESYFIENGTDATVLEFPGKTLEWRVGYLKKETQDMCWSNIFEMTANLKKYESEDYFYGIINFTSDKNVRSTIHLDYSVFAKVWLNSTVIYQSTGDIEVGLYRFNSNTQGMVKQGVNKLFVKVRRGGNDCGPYHHWWMLNVRIKPHEPTSFRIPQEYYNGDLITNYTQGESPGGPTPFKGRVATTWAQVKSR